MSSCKEVVRYLAEHPHSKETSLPGWVRDHLRWCQPCRQLWHLLQVPLRSPALPNGLSESITRQIMANLKPVRVIPSPQTLALIFTGVFLLMISAGGLLLGYKALASLTIWQIVIIGLTSIGAIALATMLFTKLIVPGDRLPLNPYWFLIMVPVLLSVVVRWLFPWRGHLFATSQWSCVLLALAFSAPAGIFALWILHRAAPLSAGLAGAIAGTFAGMVGFSVATLHCTILTSCHILSWHLIATLGISIGLGAVLGRTLGQRYFSRSG